MDLTKYHTCESPLEWHGLYGSDAKYRKYVSPESFAHPAKMSFLLCDKIMHHLEAEGLLKDGDTVVDFMAGTARTGIIAELHGHHFVGVELEKHFIEMQYQNMGWFAETIRREPSWTLLQGDAHRAVKEGIRWKAQLLQETFCAKGIHGCKVGGCNYRAEVMMA